MKMNYKEAINTFQKYRCNTIVIRTIAGRELELERRVLEAQELEGNDLYLWGGYWTYPMRAMRPLYDHVWFWLSNAEFVRPGRLNR